MKKINRLILLFTTMAVGILLTACGGYKGKKERTLNLTAMDTYMSITCYGREADEALELAEYEIKRLDELWSVSNKDSEIYRINNGTDNLLSEDTIKILEKSDLKIKVPANAAGAYKAAPIWSTYAPYITANS